ncbi:N-acetylmuramoyl-L-alanine amidase [Helicobacter felis]|uniref:N-acetylmuramoyl-L-alanine amidase n=1 Tax=Helicobacter felis (strain ATCC 49179 / CCUG 28539 / NCTC 12436 / CS1) TaxID=936155 RepID=E7ABD0_HELFC|nr:N-acetylmuramoyl-L-alanine amidase [Helicobacter felis]CBY83688.1 N-acetylmuramoyl-L-alanine amidase [Helicobacter felis ATCC 49179]
MLKASKTRALHNHGGHAQNTATRHIDKIIIHCSATKAGKDFRAKDIDMWHKQRGFKCIGYHFVILLDGTIEIGRALQQIGAHCKGHNKTSVGVCYIGGLDESGAPKNTLTDSQLTTLLTLCRELTQKYPRAKIYGHKDFNPAKACPSFEVKEVLKEFFHAK